MSVYATLSAILAELEKEGKIELLVWYINSGKAMLIYTVNGEPELVFIEEAAENTVLPIG